MPSSNKKTNTVHKFCGIFSLLTATVICIFIIIGFITRKQTLDDSVSCPYETSTEYEYNTCSDRDAIMGNSFVLFQQLSIITLFAVLPAYIILGLLALKKDA